MAPKYGLTTDVKVVERFFGASHEMCRPGRGSHSSSQASHRFRGGLISFASARLGLRESGVTDHPKLQSRRSKSTIAASQPWQDATRISPVPTHARRNSIITNSSPGKTQLDHTGATPQPRTGDVMARVHPSLAEAKPRLGPTPSFTEAKPRLGPTPSFAEAKPRLGPTPSFAEAKR